MGKRYRVGIIGCGGIAHAHARALRKIGAEMIAFCDIVEERAREYAAQYSEGKGRVYTDFSKMFEVEELDIVYICLPPFAHSNEVEMAAEKGVHILIEKPIALDLEIARKMVEAVERKGVKSQVGFLLRFGEATERLKEMIESGEAGPPGLFIGRYVCNSLHSPWWRDRSKSGGQVVEQIIHLFDMARFLMGEAESVFCFMNNIFHKDIPDYTVEDVSGTAIRFRNGSIGVIAATNGAIPGQWISRYEVITQYMTCEFTDTNNATFHLTGKGYPSRIAISSDRDLFLAESMDLIRAIETGEETKIPISEGYKSLELVLAAAKSGEKGEPVGVGA